MKNPIQIGVLLLPLLFSATSFAAAADDSDPWNDLIDRATQTGAPSTRQSGEFRTLTRGDVSAAATTPHQIQYFSAVGSLDDQENFQLNQLKLVSEAWSITADGNIRVDQWIFVTRPDGEMAQGLHEVIVETSDRVLVSADEPKETDDTLAQKFNAMIADWEDASQ